MNMAIKFAERYRFDFANYHIDGNTGKDGNSAEASINEGYFARCYKGVDTSNNRCVAIKYLRHELPHPKTGKMSPPLEVHYEAFCREADFLNLLSSTKRNKKAMARTPHLYNMGYLNGLTPTKDQRNPIDGEIEEIENADEFRKQIPDRMKAGWRPYLAIEYFPIHKSMQQIQEFYTNLFPRLSISQSNEKIYPHLPLIQILHFVVQVSRLFKVIHKNSEDNGGPIHYPDSKLPHFFWNGKNAAIIDWNRVWYLKEKGKHEFVYSGLSEETDIQHFISVPVYALMTGRNPAGRQPFFGHDAEPPNYDTELQIIQQGYPNGIYELFRDVLTPNGTIKDALTLENRCEVLLEELFGITDSNKGEEADAHHKLQEILENLEKANSLINESWDIFRDKFLFSTIPDVNYIASILDHVKDRVVIPWGKDDHCNKNF